jgi:hypothetical protein
MNRENDTQIIMLQRIHRWRMAFFGLVILLAGIVIGAAGVMIMNRCRPVAPPPAPEVAGERLMRGLDRHLDLTPGQAEAIKPVIRKHMQKLREIRMSARPRIVEQLRLMNEEVSSLLDDRQRRLWQDHLRRLQRRLEEGPRRRGGRHRGRYRRHRDAFGPPPPDHEQPPPPGEKLP